MTNNLNTSTKIVELEFPDNVRENPEIYLNGPNHCIYEIIDNSRDEAKAGICNTILISIDKNLMVTVVDNGRGIPITPSEKYPEFSQAERALSILNAGGKFSNRDGSYTENTVGKNGVGSSCVNAVSSYFEADITTGGNVYQIIFEKGLYKQRQRVVAKADPSQHGTVIKFKLDEEMYPNANYDYKALIRRIQQTAFLNPNLTLIVSIDAVDANGDEVKISKQFKYENGIKDYIEYLTNGKELSVNDIIHVDKKIEDKRLGRPLSVTAAFAYNNTFSSEVKGFANSIASENGGDHMIGFNHGICRAVRQYAVENKMIKNESDFEINDCLEGVIGIISIEIKKPVFKGQYKDSLNMPIVKGLVANCIKDELYDYLCKNPKSAKVIIDKALRARKERLAVKKIKEESRGLKSINSKSVTLGKLADCASKDPKECEIYIVEGDSAAGSAKQARDRKYQAILPVFGKVNNSIKKDKSLKELLSNEKLGLVIAALKAGIGETFDINKIRYNKVIIFSDADCLM